MKNSTLTKGLPFTTLTARLLETDPGVLLWITFGCMLCSTIQIMLGADPLAVKILFLFEDAYLLAAVAYSAKPLKFIIAVALLTFYTSGGIDYTEQLVRKYSPVPPAIIEPIPIPEDTAASEGTSIYKVFSQKVIDELRYTHKEFPLGSSHYRFIFSPSNEFYCRIISLKCSQTITLFITKDDDEYIPVKENDDWRISLVHGDRVLSSDIVKRQDDEKTIIYELPPGRFILIVERIPGNNGRRIINVASSCQ